MDNSIFYSNASLEVSTVRALRLLRGSFRTFVKNKSNPFKYLRGFRSVDLLENRPEPRNKSKLIAYMKNTARFHRMIKNMSIHVTNNFSQDLSLGKFSSLNRLHLNMKLITTPTLLFIKKLMRKSSGLEQVSGLPLRKRLVEIINRERKVKFLEGNLKDSTFSSTLSPLENMVVKKDIKLKLELTISNLDTQIFFPESINDRILSLDLRSFLENARVIDKLKFKPIQCLKMTFSDQILPQGENNFSKLQYLHELRTFHLSMTVTNNEEYLPGVFNSIRLPETVKDLKFSFHGESANFEQDKLKSDFSFLQDLSKLKHFQLENSLNTPFNNVELSHKKDRICFNLIKLILKMLPPCLEFLFITDGNLRIIGSPLKIEQNDEFFEALSKFENLKSLSFNMGVFPSKLDKAREMNIESLKLQNGNFEALLLQGITFPKLKSFLYHGRPHEEARDALKVIEWAGSNLHLETLTFVNWTDELNKDIVLETINLPSKLEKLTKFGSLFVRMTPTRDLLLECISHFKSHPALNNYNVTFPGNIIMKRKKELIVNTVGN